MPFKCRKKLPIGFPLLFWFVTAIRRWFGWKTCVVIEVLGEVSNFAFGFVIAIDVWRRQRRINDNRQTLIDGNLKNWFNRLEILGRWEKKNNRDRFRWEISNRSQSPSAYDRLSLKRRLRCLKVCSFVTEYFSRISAPLPLRHEVLSKQPSLGSDWENLWCKPHTFVGRVFEKVQIANAAALRSTINYVLRMTNGKLNHSNELLVSKLILPTDQPVLL